jgi:hypothetical protein
MSKKESVKINNTLTESNVDEVNHDIVADSLNNIFIETVKVSNESKKDDEIVDDIVEEQVFDDLYHNVKDAMRGFDLNVVNLMLLVSKVGQVVGNVKGLKSEQRRNLMYQLVLKLLGESNIEEDDMEYIQLTINNLIDTVLNVANGKIKVKVHNKKRNKRLKNIQPGQIVESLLEKVKTTIIRKSYGTQELIINFTAIVGMVMVLVEEYPDITGVEKKNIVITVLRKLIREVLPKIYSDISENTTKRFENMLNNLPDTIDLLTAISKKKIKFNKKTAIQIIKILIKCCSSEQ